jgi:hypothetical protein
MLVSDLSMKNKNVLNRVVNVCEKVVGESQASLCALYERRAANKAKAITKDATHVLAEHYQLLPSGRSFNVPRLSTVRAKKSFMPMTVQILNKHNYVNNKVVCGCVHVSVVQYNTL